jgi:hypothetical protein
VGQVDHAWGSPVSGLWTDPLNWIPGQVPNGADQRAVLGLESAYEVLLNNQPAVLDQLRIENPSAVLRVVKSSGNGRVLDVGAGGIVNNGTILLEGLSNAWNVVPSATIGGSGAIRISGSSTLFASNGAQRVKHLSGHTIAGYGRITNLENAGLIVADVPSTTLTLDTILNHGSVVAGPGTTVNVFEPSSSYIASGKYLAEGAGAKISGQIRRGGTVETRDGGVFADVILEDVTTEGDVTVADISMYGSLTHNGRMIVADSSIYIGHMFPSNLILAGNGEIHMMSPGSDVQLHSPTVQHAFDYTVRGQGRIWSIKNVFTSHGKSSADVAGGELRISSINNASIFEAVNGGSLLVDGRVHNTGEIVSRTGSKAQIGGHIVQSDEGVIRAEGTIKLGSPCCELDIDGGTLECTDDGLLQAEGSLLLNAVRLTGRMDVSRYGARLIWGCTNDGEVVLGSEYPATLRLGQYSTHDRLDGTGTITLNHPESSIRTGNIVVDVGAGQTIRGTGEVAGVNIPEKLFVHGIISPGLPDAPFGSMTLANVSLSATSVIELDIGTSKRDIVQILKATTNSLAGLLRVHFHEGRTLASCEELALFENATYTGEFAAYDLPAMPLGRLQVRYDPGAIVLVYNPADYDGSTFVDTDDFTAFIADFEAGNDASDINHSGAVDGEDFVDFVTAFEQGC